VRQKFNLGIALALVGFKNKRQIGENVLLERVVGSCSGREKRSSFLVGAAWLTGVGVKSENSGAYKHQDDQRHEDAALQSECFQPRAIQSHELLRVPDFVERKKKRRTEQQSALTPRSAACAVCHQKMGEKN
jgi:hypothetical protein